jgi:hypothetical protein
MFAAYLGPAGLIALRRDSHGSWSLPRLITDEVHGGSAVDAYSVVAHGSVLLGVYSRRDPDVDGLCRFFETDFISQPAVSPFGDPGGCWDPSIAIAKDGTRYVSYSSPSGLMVESFGGVKPGARANVGGGGNSKLAIDGLGFVHLFYLSAHPLARPLVERVLVGNVWTQPTVITWDVLYWDVAAGPAGALVAWSQSDPTDETRSLIVAARSVGAVWTRESVGVGARLSKPSLAINPRGVVYLHEQHMGTSMWSSSVPNQWVSEPGAPRQCPNDAGHSFPLAAAIDAVYGFSLDNTSGCPSEQEAPTALNLYTFTPEIAFPLRTEMRASERG